MRYSNNSNYYLLSFILHVEDEELLDGDIGKKKRRSLYAPSQCSTKKSGSVISLRKSTGTKSMNLEDSEFEFEFAMNSDGLYKNTDYR